MRITIGIEKMPEEYLHLMEKDLARYAICRVTKSTEEITVEAEGDVVQCSAVVAICDKYRFNKQEILNSG